MDELLEWTQNYIKNKDLTLKKIKTIETDQKKKIIRTEYSDKTTTFTIKDVLNVKGIASHNTIVCPNSEENFNSLVKNWKKLSALKDFNIMFVSLKNNDKWIINPYVHSLIADPDNIENGLRAMFDTANGKIVDIKPIKKKMFDETDEEE